MFASDAVGFVMKDIDTSMYVISCMSVNYAYLDLFGNY
jgi:hypothetical protein